MANKDIGTEFLIPKGERGSAPANGMDTLMSLMATSPYIWQGGGMDSHLTWHDTSLTASLFCTRPEDVPQSVSALRERLCDDAHAKRTQAYASLSWDGAKFQIDYKIRTFDGRNIWVEERGQRLEGEGGRATKVVGVLTNIQTRKTREEQAGYHASFDSLTGLWNKTRMSEGIAQMLAVSKRYDRPAAYMTCSISNLHDINMNYGYEAGDRLLCAVAKRLTSCVRAPDICARLSGSSFGVGLSDCDSAQMHMVATRIVETLTARPYGTPYGDLYAEFSLGGHACSDETRSAVDVMECALTALTHSEKNGGELVIYSADLPDLKPRQSISDFTRDDIITALNERNITLAYQPLIHAESRETHHYECLLRLRRDDGELISAAHFIMAAEELGCVHLLDRRALEIAARTLQDRSDIRLAINVSAATVQNPDTARAYLQALRGLGRDTQRVIVEMTETVALESPDMASSFSQEVRSFGCQFAIDDFGAGHTTFSNLLAVEADEIKIDGSFIRDLSLTPHKQVFVRMMVDLAKTFSIKTVAEMVGSREDADLLTRLGVDYLQGYMFGLPGAIPVQSAKTSQAK